MKPPRTYGVSGGRASISTHQAPERKVDHAAVRPAVALSAAQRATALAEDEAEGRVEATAGVS